MMFKICSLILLFLTGLNSLLLNQLRGKHLLDVVLFNQPIIAADVQVRMPFSNNDHSRVDFDIAPQSCNGVFTGKVSRKKYLWRQADF